MAFQFQKHREKTHGFNLSFDSVWNAAWGRVAQHSTNPFACKRLAQFSVAVARKKLPQIFIAVALIEITPQQSLDRIRHFAGQASIANRACDGLVQPDSPSHAEVVSVQHAITNLDFLALDPNVGDP